MARAARVMATATKMAMATDGNNTGNCYGKEGGNNGDSTKDKAARATIGERRVIVQWAMVCVYLLVCVERPQKTRKRAKL